MSAYGLQKTQALALGIDAVESLYVVLLSHDHHCDNLDRAGRDAATVFTPLGGEDALVRAGVLTRSMAAAEAAWRGDLTSVLVPLGLAVPPAGEPPADGRTSHSDAFRWLWGEFTAVRQLDPAAVW